MRLVNRWATFILVCLLSACSSMDSTFKGKTYEYMAWFDGESAEEQAAYRSIVSEKLEEVDSDDSDFSRPDKFLNDMAIADSKGKKGIESKLKAFIAKNPTDSRGQFILAVHYMRNKRKELALHLFSQLEKDSKFPWKSLLYNNLGMLSLVDKERDKALAYFEKAVASEPPIAASRVNLGALYIQSKSYAQAQPLFAKALEIDPDFEDAVLGLGACLESQGKFDEVHKLYSEYASGHPESVAVLYNNAVILGKHLGKREEASELMLRYIQRGGKDKGKAHEMIQGWR